MSPGASKTLDYTPGTRTGLRLRRLTAHALITVLCLALFSIALTAAGNAYAAERYTGLKPGMTRAQVERHLWAFARRPFQAYQGAGPGRFVIRYEFLRLGKNAAIQVIYNANGTVADPQPLFNN